jgi:Glycosyltransferase family 87
MAQPESATGSPARFRLESFPARELAALGALLGVVATGAGIALSSASTANSFGIPRQGDNAERWVVGPLAPFGGALTPPRFIVLLAAMWCFYLVVLALADAVRIQWAIAAIVILTVLFAIAPPLFSRDVFNYIDYGRLFVVHDLNPYVHGPIAAHHDPIFPFVRWRETPSAYGPLFTLVSFAFAPLGLVGALWSFKAMTGAAALSCVALLWRSARKVGASPVFAALLLGLNPVFLVLAVAGAHNDVLALLVLIVAISLAVENRESLAGCSIAVAVAVKATAGLALPFMALGSRRWSVIAGSVAGAAMLAAIGLALFGTSLAEPFNLVAKHRDYYFDQSVPPHLATLLGWDPRAGSVRLAGELLAAVAIVALLVWTVRSRDWLSAAGWATFAVLATTTYLLAWYTIWLLPFAALARNRRLVHATLAIGTFVVASRLYLLGQ